MPKLWWRHLAIARCRSVFSLPHRRRAFVRVKTASNKQAQRHTHAYIHTCVQTSKALAICYCFWDAVSSLLLFLVSLFGSLFSGSTPIRGAAFAFVAAQHFHLCTLALLWLRALFTFLLGLFSGSPSSSSTTWLPLAGWLDGHGLLACCFLVLIGLSDNQTSQLTNRH